MKNLKTGGLIALIIVYVAAGANHFRDPSFYLEIIPHYFPVPKALNYLAGFCEVVFGLLLAFPATRQFAAWGIVLMLLAFLPVHINMVINAPLYLASLKITPFLIWARLLILQPLLILWAWLFTGRSENSF